MEKNLDISVVVPVYNEKGNIEELYSRINSSIRSITDSFEIIIVDDGSTDGSFDEIKRLSKIKAFKLNKNYGKSYALACGIHNASGQIIVTIDGDLENHPEDIPSLINKIKEGYDVVTGWRKDRWNSSFFSRKLPSLIANWLISLISKLKIHDHGCGLTAFKSDLLKDFIFSDQIHRMIIPYIAIKQEVKVFELEVGFTTRKYGKSKYGISRTFSVILDLISYIFFKNYAKKPMHFFGNTGLFFVYWDLVLLYGHFL